MKTKGSIFGFAALALLLYECLMFIIFGFDGGLTFWISFAFASLSIILAFAIVGLSISNVKRMTDWIFSWPIVRWGIIYVIIEIILSLVFMILEDTPWRVALVSQLLLTVFLLILVLPCFAQRSHVASVTKETTVKVSYIRLMHAKLLALVPRTENPDVKKDIEKAADMLRHSDPMSADSLREHEKKLSAYVDQLDSMVRDHNYAVAAPLAKEICLLIEERNQLVIASKLIQH